MTEEALDYALETVDLPPDGDLRTRLMELYRVLGTFPEVSEVLRRLREAGFVTAILSSGSPDMLGSAVQSAELGGHLDAVLSVDEVRTFKPDRGVYQLAVHRLGVPVEAIAFQSSNAWDAHAAAAFGMRAVWCNRHEQRGERLPGTPVREVRSLAELPALLAP